MSDDHFAVDVALLSYENALRGDDISACISELDNPGSIRKIIDIMSSVSGMAMTEYRAISGSPMPISASILYHGGMAIAYPKKFETFEDKVSFYGCLQPLSFEISENMNDRPLLVSISSEVWSCSVRKSIEKDLSKISRSLGLGLDDSEVKSKIVNFVVGEYGSIGEIPDDHPYVKKFDVMLFLSGFLTMDGPRYISRFGMISDDRIDDVDESCIPCCKSYHIEQYLTGNIKFDVSEYRCVGYSESSFK